MAETKQENDECWQDEEERVALFLKLLVKIEDNKRINQYQ